MGASKKARSIFICFTGIDGAGKTMHAITLCRAMKDNYTYTRVKPFLLKPVMALGKALLLRSQSVSHDYAAYAKAKRELFRNRLLSGAYQYALLIEYFSQAFFKIKLPLMFGKNIVCDRYIYDTIITDFALDLNYSGKEVDVLLGKCFRILPKPDLFFLIDVPEEIAFQRKTDIPSVDYLEERRRLYLHLAKRDKVIILDGSKDPEELERVIQDRVLERVATSE